MYLQTTEDNFCNYYILPLLKIGKNDFGTGFINSYVDIDKKQLLVKTAKRTSINFKYWEHSDFVTDYTVNNHLHIVFMLPIMFHTDVKKFIKGKYSEFSKEAKDLIKKYSGLHSNVKVRGNKKESDFRILILNRHIKLKQELEKVYGFNIPANQELASPPFEENFIDLNL